MSKSRGVFEMLSDSCCDFKSSSRGCAENANAWNEWINPSHDSIRTRTDGESNHASSWVEASWESAKGWDCESVRNESDLDEKILLRLHSDA
jgi:hypothetical protein